MKLYKKLMIAGGILVMVFNPLSVALWNDALTTGLNWLAAQLIHISNYTVIIGGTLLAVSLIVYLDGRSKKETAKLKKLKTRPTEKAGEFID